MNKKILAECLSIARSEIERHPEKDNFMHWSFVVVGKKIIGYDVNKTFCVKNIRFFGYTNEKRFKAHAELNAILKCHHYIYHKHFTLVNVRLSKKGELRNSMPCEVCYAFSKKNGAKHIYFTSNFGFHKLE